ncbi:KdsC family phosphatase [Campylobacter sputorum]|uniref:KdsC family phosphatase n=1 Tax=Campylobacter sputorum TaxID=206 RepID=UPI000B771E07|nr:HAD hydrolase family protein [Campylobacter sputorum]ASM37405.1 3-deoxy-D-manno-octulosonate 8-phosphate phosphatase, YrbI family [Campylobacter sputorum bv. faecalis CCUG 20703]
MIEIVFLDVDGCLTDGKIIYSPHGEIKEFDVKDGFGIEGWLKLGKKVAIITKRNSPRVEERARDLKISYVFQGVKDKLKTAEEILKKENLSLENAAAIGDDYNDQVLLSKVKRSFKPNDATHGLLVQTTLTHNGGNGAIREMIEILMKENGIFEDWVKVW